MKNTEQTGKHLEKLSGSDFEIKDGEPDIRGWDVKDRNGKQVGKVDELIFDIEVRKVRYMVVDTKNNDYEMDRKHILVPIGLGELHTSDNDVYLPGVSTEQVKSYPEYDNDDITREHETSVRNLFPINDAGAVDETGLALDHMDTYAGFYDNDFYNENNLFKNRRTSVLDEETIDSDIDDDAEDYKNTAANKTSKNIGDAHIPSSDFSGGDL